LAQKRHRNTRKFLCRSWTSIAACCEISVA
jgi:hypothetical protein